MIFNRLIALLAIVVLISCSRKCGVVGDGKTLNTAALQHAIDECSSAGGGTVSLPAGEYLTGTLYLKSNVTLNLEKGAVLRGSRNPADYPEKGRRKALIFAEDASNIALTGEGEIYGSGDAFVQFNNAPDRPVLVQFFDCSNLTVKNIKMAESAFWTCRLVRCDGVDVSGVSIVSHTNWNNDGFDIESRNVVITDCTVDTDDDALCFKSEDPDFVVENITVSKCRLQSNCNFIKFGTASAGGFRNIRISDCQLSQCSQSRYRFWEKTVPGVTQTVTGIAGIALEVVDGGFMEDVHISDITMQDVQTPVFVRLGKRKTSDNTYLKNAVIENITATSASFIASSVTGVPSLKVANITFRNFDLRLKAGGKSADANLDVPEKEASYPENRMFGVMLPAYGFYLRHADNLLFDNIKLSYFGDLKEERHAIVADDVTNLTVANAVLQSPESPLPVFLFRDCRAIDLSQGVTCAGFQVKLYEAVNTPDSEIKWIDF